MASVNTNGVIKALRGSIGKELVFRVWSGKTVVSKYPKKSSGKQTAAQEKTRSKFMLGTRYAKAIVNSADQSLADAYAFRLKDRQNIYSRALEDFMSVPLVHFIDTKNYRGAVGDTIIVRAVDDFRVTAVRVELFNADGSLLETGTAVQNLNGIDWTYTAVSENSLQVGCRIRATATDIPRNEGVLEVEIAE